MLADGYRDELDRLGYTAYSREYKVNQMANLSRWMEARGLGLADLDKARVEAFLADFGRRRREPPTFKAMKPLMDWLAAQGAISAEAEAVATPLDEVLVVYRAWMVAERALAARTIERYEATARRFLSSCSTADPRGAAGQLTGESFTSFLLAEVKRGIKLGSLQGRVAELRSLARFMFVTGMTATSLAESVPPVPGWKQRTVPPRMGVGEIRSLLDSCDRQTPAGRRDYAVLVLLARLGLRANEVAGLDLEDVDWLAGELVIAGKGRRDDRMPLPADVGEALAGYLSGRPRVQSRRVFVTLAAPYRPLGKTSVSEMVIRRCRRVGIAAVRAHRLRHALASQMLAEGVTLREIGQVLRQRDLATTAQYAKVDYAKLAELALPWPVTR